MKNTILAIAAILFSLNSFALSQESKEHLEKLDQNRTSLHPTSYLVDIDLQDFLSKTLSQVWGDEYLSGHCFGIQASDFGPLQRDIRGGIAYDRYPVSWRAMSRKYSDIIYRESKSFLSMSISDASQVAAKFRKDVQGKYFKGCELSWLGSFGGGSSSFFISEDGSIKFGRISSWSE